MTDDTNWDEELQDDPDYQAMTPEQREKIIHMLERMMEMGMGAIYGDESDYQPDADIPCEQYLNHCKSECCTYQFALTKEEVATKRYSYNEKRPFFIARDEDGYCPHLDRESMKCDVWENRPLRCRRYSCRDDKDIWPEGFPG